jgi:hypothetical protein
MKKLFIILSIGLFSSSFLSCKKEGCTDQQANNYSADAKTDNGSCKYDRDAFIGTFNMTYTASCDDGDVYNGNAPITISSSSAAKNKVIFTWEGMNLTGTIAGNSITIESQLVDGSTYSGSGSLNGSVLTMTIYDQWEITCVYSMSGNKQ